LSTATSLPRRELRDQRDMGDRGRCRRRAACLAAATAWRLTSRRCSTTTNMQRSGN